jgi:hypothetical protein
MEPQAAENDSPATMPEQHAQDASVHLPQPQQSIDDANGMNMAMGLTVPQFDSTGLMLSNQDGTFTAMPQFGNGINGMAFHDPNMMMPTGQLMGTSAPAPSTNGKAISAGKLIRHSPIPMLSRAHMTIRRDRTLRSSNSTVGDQGAAEDPERECLAHHHEGARE